MKGKNTAHSIRERLLNYAKNSQQDFSLVLLRYANERMLYRLGKSAFADRFLLKGATLFLIWNESKPHRPTRDVDLLGFGPEDEHEIRHDFLLLCAMHEEDGIEYDPASITIGKIREDQRYGGRRVELRGTLHGARVALQFDIGFGDVVTPAPDFVEIPVILSGLEAPRLMAYPVYTVIAEKLEAMVQLGIDNSRMKDFYDLDFLLARFALDDDILRQAIRNTFERRQTPLPTATPTVFSPEFLIRKALLWQQFLKRNQLLESDRSWEAVLDGLRDRLLPLLGQ